MTRSGFTFRLWIRRAHLYCGLALVPWVLLYAASGMLFNHPGWTAPDDGPRHFSVSQLDAALRERGVLDAQAGAKAVAAMLGDDVVVHASPPPTLTSRLHAKRTDGTDELWLRFPVRRGSWGTRPDTARVPASLAELEPLQVHGHDREAWQAFSDAVAADLEGRRTTTALSRTPTLRFNADIDAEAWVVEYDAKSGGVSFEAIEDREVRIPRLLARLHMTHVYPDTLGAAWLHAIIVDLSALCLVMWCITGLCMWWWMRKLRVVGGIVIVTGLAFTAALLVDVVPPML